MRAAMTRRRLLGLGGCLTIGIVLLVVALVRGGGEDRPKVVPEGGSAFGAGVKAQAPPAAVAAPAPKPTPEPAAAAPASAKPSGKLPASVARSAARLFLVGFGGPRPPRDVLRRGFAEHEWGGVVLEPGNGDSPQQVAGLVGRIRGAALDARHVPPLIAASQLGGDLDAVPIGSEPQSAVRDAAGARAAALGAAKAVHPLGIRMVLAPDADLGFAGGPWDGVAFSDDPRAVAAMTGAAVSGWKDGEVASVPGHFPGEGAASGDPAVEAATVGLSLEDLKARDFLPFREIADHAPAIQLSSATYVAFDGVTPATLLPEVVALLRDDLKFEGVVVSGDLAAASLASGEPVADLAVAAIKAGVDLAWIPGDAADQDAAWRAVARALRTGEIAEARVAEALTRVSVLRATYGVK
jgi:beta-N-acetylhexosaminidase